MPAYPLQGEPRKLGASAVIRNETMDSTLTKVFFPTGVLLYHLTALRQKTNHHN